MCEIKGCKIKEAYGFEGSKASRCKTHSEPGMVNVRSKRCFHDGCLKQPYFNNEETKQGKFCALHKLPGMINVKTKLCKHEGCERMPTFGIKGNVAEYCFKHKLSNMVDVKSKMCAHLECNTQASYGNVGEKAKCCSTHKLSGMVDVKHNRCASDSCEKLNPIYDVVGGKGKYCASHKEPGMINVKSIQCNFPSCKIIPMFNYPGEKGKYCASHKEPGMINVEAKACEYHGCLIQPSFDIIGGKGRFCTTHKLPGMVDVKHNRCASDGCEKLNPIYDFVGGKGKYCASHAEPGMVNVKDKLCEHPDCNIHAWYGIPGKPPTSCAQHRKAGMLRNPSARCKNSTCRELAIYGKNNEPFRCEEHKLENDQNLVERECTSCHLPMVLNMKNLCELCDPEAFQQAALAKQRQVMAHLDAKNLKGTSTDRMIDGGLCGKERPDRVFELADRVIILEVDENQHKGRPCECEQTRMVNITQTFGGLPTYWIRFNPDEYKSFRSAKQKTIQQRLTVLSSVIKHLISNAEKPTALSQVLHLYFDGWKETNANNWETLLAWEESTPL